MAQYTLFTLFSLILLSTLSRPPSAPSLDLYATKSGNITLGQDGGGFYVPIDFKNYEYEASDGVSSYDMSLCLYSSQTFLATYSCLDFFGYSCQSYPQCETYQASPFSAEYVQFSATGSMMSTSIYLDYSNWYLDERAGYASNCTTNVSLPYGNSRYGLLGMGFANGGQDNYPRSRMFSLSLNETNHSGSLLFHSGSSAVEFPTYTPVVTIQTDNNWNINTSALITIGYNSIEFETTVIFDLNSDLLGFPVSIYDYLIKSLEKNTSMSCSNATFKPVCSFTGNVLALPNITLAIQNQNIQIPPNIYVQWYYIYNSPANSSYSLTLNLRAISSSLLNDSYVSPAFNDFVILDQNFLLYYITLFNATGYNTSNFEVTLYAPPYTNNNVQPTPTPVPTPDPSSSSKKWIWIPIGIVIFAVLVVIITAIVRCHRKKKAATLLSAYDGNVMGTEEPAQNYQNYPYNMQPQDYNPNQNYYYPQHQQYSSQTYGNNEQGYGQNSY